MTGAGALEGKVALITGASAGIGEACAYEFTAAGASVVLAARRADRLTKIEEKLGDRAIAVPSDVRKPADAKRMVDVALDRLGKLDILIANAGIGMYGGILDHSDDDIATMLDINVAGTVWPVRAAVPALLQTRGDLVIVSSVAGTDARANEAVYAATKHAQMGLAQGLDRELHGQGVRVSVFCPGGVVTEFAMQPGGGRTAESPELKDMLSANDVAAAILAAVSEPRSVRTLVHRLRGQTEDD